MYSLDLLLLLDSFNWGIHLFFLFYFDLLWYHILDYWFLLLNFDSGSNNRLDLRNRRWHMNLLDNLFFNNLIHKDLLDDRFFNDLLNFDNLLDDLFNFNNFVDLNDLFYLYFNFHNLLNFYDLFHYLLNWNLHFHDFFNELLDGYLNNLWDIYFFDDPFNDFFWLWLRDIVGLNIHLFLFNYYFSLHRLMYDVSDDFFFLNMIMMNFLDLVVVMMMNGLSVMMMNLLLHFDNFDFRRLASLLVDHVLNFLDNLLNWLLESYNRSWRLDDFLSDEHAGAYEITLWLRNLFLNNFHDWYFNFLNSDDFNWYFHTLDLYLFDNLDNGLGLSVIDEACGDVCFLWYWCSHLVSGGYISFLNSWSKSKILVARFNRCPWG